MTIDSFLKIQKNLKEWIKSKIFKKKFWNEIQKYSRSSKRFGKSIFFRKSKKPSNHDSLFIQLKSILSSFVICSQCCPGWNCLRAPKGRICLGWISWAEPWRSYYMLLITKITNITKKATKTSKMMKKSKMTLFEMIELFPDLHLLDPNCTSGQKKVVCSF